VRSERGLDLDAQFVEQVLKLDDLPENFLVCRYPSSRTLALDPDAAGSAATEQGIKEALKGFEGYKFDVGEQEDSSWNQYLNVLYPSMENLECIANMDLLDELVKKGDVLAKIDPRPLQAESFRASPGWVGVPMPKRSDGAIP
jgi:hypothetical protein